MCLKIPINVIKMFFNLTDFIVNHIISCVLLPYANKINQ